MAAKADIAAQADEQVEQQHWTKPRLSDADSLATEHHHQQSEEPKDGT